MRAAQGFALNRFRAGRVLLAEALTFCSYLCVRPGRGTTKGVFVRGILRKLALPLAALFVLVAASTAGGASRAGTLVFGGVGEPTYLDPALVSDGVSFTVTEQIFEGLVRLKPGTTKVIPALATKWKLSGGKTWTFWLRHGVKFHDGTPWN